MSDPATHKIALLGATGAIGCSVAASLTDRGVPFRAVGRDIAQLASVFGKNRYAELTAWNPDDPGSIRTALKDIDTVVYLVGVPYWKFRQHPVLMDRVVGAAIASGVERVLLVGTLYVFGPAQTPRIAEDHPRAPHTFKGRMRKKQEDVLMGADAKGKLKATILRLPDFYGPDVEGSLVRDLFLAAAKGRTANLIGPIDKPHEFVFVPDVGDVVARMLETPQAFGHTWNLGGAGTITQRELATLAFGDRKPRVRVVGKAGLRMLGLFQPMMRELVEMNYLMTDPLIVDDTALSTLLGGLKKTPYAEGVAKSMAAVRAV